jgi:hypothetical protein
VILVRGGQAELAEDARHVLLDCAERDHHLVRDRLVRAALRHQLEHLALARGQILERVVAPSSTDELGDDGRVERRCLAFEPDSPEEWFEFVAQSVGPFINARDQLDESRFEAMRTDLVSLFREAEQGGRLEQEYLLAIVRL